MALASITKFKFSTPTRQTLNKNNGQSDYVGVDRFIPDKNEVVLRNGRTIKYDNLVIAMGQKENYQEIKGFDDAWADTVNPFYTNADHPSWKTTVSKTYRVHLNFNGGDAYFYIPPTNFIGEIEDYNFLVSKAIWDLHAKVGKISWETSRFTVINPNKTFSRHFPKLDEYLRNACQQHNINIETDLKLVEVRKVLPLPRRATTPPSSSTLPDSSWRGPTTTSTPSCPPPPTPPSRTQDSPTPPATSTSTPPLSSTRSTTISSVSETSLMLLPPRLSSEVSARWQWSDTTLSAS